MWAELRARGLSRQQGCLRRRELGVGELASVVTVGEVLELCQPCVGIGSDAWAAEPVRRHVMAIDDGANRGVRALVAERIRDGRPRVQEGMPRIRRRSSWYSKS